MQLRHSFGQGYSNKKFPPRLQILKRSDPYSILFSIDDHLFVDVDVDVPATARKGGS